MTRNELKTLVKECLAEILVEGLGESPLIERKRRAPMVAEDDASRFGAVAEAAKKRQKVLRSQRGSTSDRYAPSQALKKAIIETAGGNPILQDIFADTAATTLQEQAKHPGAPMGGVEMAIADIPPQELFGDDNAEKWAQLAFMDHKPSQLAKKSS